MSIEIGVGVDIDLSGRRGGEGEGDKGHACIYDYGYTRAEVTMVLHTLYPACVLIGTEAIGINTDINPKHFLTSAYSSPGALAFLLLPVYSLHDTTMRSAISRINVGNNFKPIIYPIPSPSNDDDGLFDYDWDRQLY